MVITALSPVADSVNDISSMSCFERVSVVGTGFAHERRVGGFKEWQLPWSNYGLPLTELNSN